MRIRIAIHMTEGARSFSSDLSFPLIRAENGWNLHITQEEGEQKKGFLN